MDETNFPSEVATNQLADMNFGKIKFAKFHQCFNLGYISASFENIGNIEIGHNFLINLNCTVPLHDFADWKLLSSQSPLAYSSFSQELKYKKRAKIATVHWLSICINIPIKYLVYSTFQLNTWYISYSYTLNQIKLEFRTGERCPVAFNNLSLWSWSFLVAENCSFLNALPCPQIKVCLFWPNLAFEVFPTCTFRLFACSPTAHFPTPALFSLLARGEIANSFNIWRQEQINFLHFCFLLSFLRG